MPTVDEIALLKNANRTPNQKIKSVCGESPALSSISASHSFSTIGNSNLVIDENHASMTDACIRLVQLKNAVMEKKYLLKYYEVHLARLKQKRIRDQFSNTSGDNSTTKKNNIYEFTKILQDNLVENKISHEKTLANLNSELKIKNNLVDNPDGTEFFACKECDHTFFKLITYLDHLFSNEHLHKFDNKANFQGLSDVDNQNMKFIADNDDKKVATKGIWFFG